MSRGRFLVLIGLFAAISLGLLLAGNFLFGSDLDARLTFSRGMFLATAIVGIAVFLYVLPSRTDGRRPPPPPPPPEIPEPIKVAGTRRALRMLSVCAFTCVVFWIVICYQVRGVRNLETWQTVLQGIPLATSVITTVAAASLCKFRPLLTLRAWSVCACGIIFLSLVGGLGAPLFAIHEGGMDRIEAWSELLLPQVIVVPIAAVILCLAWHRWGRRLPPFT
jgi:hypothetical protein